MILVRNLLKIINRVVKSGAFNMVLVEIIDIFTYPVHGNFKIGIHQRRETKTGMQKWKQKPI